MESTNLLQIIYGSIGIAIGAVFSLYYMFKALSCLAKDNSSIVTVACLSLVITAITLIKNRKMHKS